MKQRQSCCQLNRMAAKTWRDIKTAADNDVWGSEYALYLFTSLSHFTLLGKKKQHIKRRKSQEELGSAGEPLRPPRVRLHLRLNSCQIVKIFWMSSRKLPN